MLWIGAGVSQREGGSVAEVRGGGLGVPILGIFSFGGRLSMVALW